MTGKGTKKAGFSIAAALLAAAVLCTLALTGCGSGMSGYDKYISELRTGVFTASNENVSVSAVTGRREEPFVIDGKSGGKSDFTVITVKPREFVPNLEYNYVLKKGDRTFEGRLVMHPFGESYSANIDEKLDLDGFSFTLSLNGSAQEFILKSVVSDNMINAERAFEIGLGELKPKVDAMMQRGTVEIYVRLIDNPINDEGGYYWYVAFVGEETYAVLIDPVTEAIAARRA